MHIPSNLGSIFTNLCFMFFLPRKFDHAAEFPPRLSFSIVLTFDWIHQAVFTIRGKVYDVYDTIEDIQKAVTGELKAIPCETFSNAMKKMKTRAELCIQSNGSYFE